MHSLYTIQISVIVDFLLCIPGRLWYYIVGFKIHFIVIEN